MKCLRNILIFLVLLIQPALLFSQSDKDKIEALRISFISKKIELSPDETEKFWPIYNEYNDKVKAVRKNLRLSYKKRQGNITDKDAEELYILEVQSRQAELDLYKQYSEKIKSVIGIKKLARLHLAEEEFKREIINSIKEKGD
jgi:hypothetical protein